MQGFGSVFRDGGCKKNVMKEVKDKRFCVMESNEVVRPRGLELF